MKEQTKLRIGWIVWAILILIAMLVVYELQGQVIPENQLYTTPEYRIQHTQHHNTVLPEPMIWYTMPQPVQIRLWPSESVVIPESMIRSRRPAIRRSSHGVITVPDDTTRRRPIILQMHIWYVTEYRVIYPE